MDKKTMAFIGKYASVCKGKMVGSILFSVASIFVGFVPYVAVFKLLTGFINHTITIGLITKWGGSCIGGYLLKLLLFEISTTLSHISAYTILEKIRTDITGKMLQLPLGYVIDRPIGKLKNLIIDQTETIELPLAHLIPEGTAYILAPLAVFLFLLRIHWLMAIASLLSFALGMFVSVPMMRSMNEKYDEYMAANNYMNSVIVEYIEGIEVIKTFNQTDKSYAKFTSAIEDFRRLTLDWFRSTWAGGNLMMAIMPTTLLGVLPIGMGLYMRGSLSIESLVLCIILSMAVVGPLMGLTTYLNSLKMIKYAAQSLDEILGARELPDEQTEVPLDNYEIKFEHVDFSYKEGEGDKVIDDLSLTIQEGAFTALIGPSGGGKSTVARLISRFWDVGKGRVTIGGVDINYRFRSYLISSVMCLRIIICLIVHCWRISGLDVQTQRTRRYMRLQRQQCVTSLSRKWCMVITRWLARQAIGSQGERNKELLLLV